MKTIKLLTLCLSLGVVSLVSAQDNVNINNNNNQSTGTTSSGTTDRRDKLQIGVKGGADYSGVWNTKGQNLVNSPVWGYAYGGFLSIPLGTYIGIQPEVMYDQKGFSQTGTTLDGGQFSYTDRTDWLDVPLLFQFKPAESVYLLGGPMYSYLLQRTQNFTNGVTSQTTQQEFQNANLNKNIFGLMFGIDLNFWPMVLSGRVGWDLTNNYNNPSTVPQYRNVLGQVSLGFRF